MVKNGHSFVNAQQVYIYLKIKRSVHQLSLHLFVCLLTITIRITYISDVVLVVVWWFVNIVYMLTQIHLNA